MAVPERCIASALSDAVVVMNGRSRERLPALRMFQRMANAQGGDGVDGALGSESDSGRFYSRFSVKERIAGPVVSGGRFASPGGNLGASNAGLTS